MKKRIYRNMCLVVLLAVVLATAVTTFVYYENLKGRIGRELTSEARYLETGLALSGEDYLEELAGKIRETDKNRVTLIDRDGTVLYDNYAEPETMENHGNRQEVRGALETGEGTASRMSDTLSMETFYYARRLEDGRVIRLAAATGSVFSNIVRMLPVLCGAAAVICLFCILLSDRLTEAIVKPVNDLDLDHPGDAKVYDELAPLLGRIERQQETIKNQMELLIARQKEFTAITENMSEGFIIIGKKGEAVSYNSSALRILGAEQVCSDGNGRVNVLSLNRSRVFQKSVDEALAGRHSQQYMEMSGRVYQIIANPVQEGREITGAIMVILDVTEARERESLRREFTANVSHELKTPLTSISGYAEIMKNGLVRQEDMKRFSQNIYDEAQRMIALVGDILRLSQLDEEKVDEHRENADLYSIAESVAGRLKDRARQAKVELRLEGTAVTVRGSRQILDEMIFNLCDNAIKYNNPGGHVTVTVSRENGLPQVIVADDGIGIPEEDQSRVFERFYRVDKSRSRQIGGTGLGLSIVKHGALYHNARVELESRVGEGTKITVRFGQ